MSDSCLLVTFSDFVCSEELNRPENESLKPIVEKLKSLKAKIDEKTEKSKCNLRLPFRLSA